MDDARHTESSLIDPPKLDLTRLGTLDDSVLGHALRRVLHETTDPCTAIAGFNSGAPPMLREYTN